MNELGNGGFRSAAPTLRSTAHTTQQYWVSLYTHQGMTIPALELQTQLVTSLSKAIVSSSGFGFSDLETSIDNDIEAGEFKQAESNCNLIVGLFSPFVDMCAPALKNSIYEKALINLKKIYRHFDHKSALANVDELLANLNK